MLIQYQEILFVRRIEWWMLLIRAKYFWFCFQTSHLFPTLSLSLAVCSSKREPLSRVNSTRLLQFTSRKGHLSKRQTWFYRVSQKHALSECYWSHSALAQTQVTGTPCEKKLIFWSFLAKTKPDQNVTIGAKFCSIAWDQIWAIFCSIKNISCDWARSFSVLTSVNKTELFGVLKS